MREHPYNLNWTPKRSDPQSLALALVMTQRMSTLPEWGRRAYPLAGRPWPQSSRALIASLLTTLMEERVAQVTRIDRVQQGFERKSQDDLGIIRHSAPEILQPADPDMKRSQKLRPTKPQEGLGRMFNEMAWQIEASPVYGGDRKLTEDQLTENLAFQHLVLDDLVGGWIPALPPPDFLTTDATGIRSFARANKDPDFAWVQQTPTNRDDVQQIYGGYGTILAGGNLAGKWLYPEVTWGFRLPLPTQNAHLDDVVFELLESAWLARGFMPHPLVSDSYYPHLKDWSLNLATRGFPMIADLQSQDRGRKLPDVRGGANIDAWVHCPFHRLNEDLPSPKQEGQKLLDYQAGNRYRHRFACEVIQEDATSLTLICPAQAGRCKCQCWTETSTLGDAYPEVQGSPHELKVSDRPPICRGPITIPRTHRWIRKTWMPYYFGGDDWRAFFTAGRPTAEGVFGILFGDNTQKATVGVTNWVGQARTALVYAAALAVSNVLILRAWWRDPGNRRELPDEYRQALEEDPLLWPTDRLHSLLPVLLNKMALDRNTAWV